MFVFLVIVKDYSRRFIVMSVNYFVYELLIGRVIVLVSIRNKNLLKNKFIIIFLRSYVNK